MGWGYFESFRWNHDHGLPLTKTDRKRGAQYLLREMTPVQEGDVNRLSHILPARFNGANLHRGSGRVRVMFSRRS